MKIFQKEPLLNTKLLRSSVAAVKFGQTWTLFAPFTQMDGNFSPEELTGIPEVLSFGGKTAYPVQIAGGTKIDLAPWLGAELHSKINALVYIPFTVADESVSLSDSSGNLNKELNVFLGVGADWWYKAWVDGRPVHDTLTIGNQTDQYSPLNNVFQVVLKPGEHLLAIRFISGSAGSTLCVGAIPQAEAGDR